MLLEVVPAARDVADEAVLGVRASLLDGVVGGETEHGEVLEGEAHREEAAVKLGAELDAHLEARVLQHR